MEQMGKERRKGAPEAQALLGGAFPIHLPGASPQTPVV